MLNGTAIYLPKPIYPVEAKGYCADGKVYVEVLIGQKGQVLTAKAIRGDQLLRESSINAAKKARFHRPRAKKIKNRGLIVYNFDSMSRCIDAGIVNKKATSIPKPTFQHACRCSGTIVVFIVINEIGDVISARTFAGHPLLRFASEKSASGAKFGPTMISGPLKVKAILTYTFDSSGEIKY